VHTDLSLKMSSTHPYAKSPPSKVDTEDDNNVSMRDNSPSSKDLDVEEPKKMMGEENKDDESSHNQANWVAKEEIDFEEHPFQIPPCSTNRSTKKHFMMMITPTCSGPHYAYLSQKTQSIQWLLFLMPSRNL